MKNVKALKLHFRNGQSWNIDLEHVGDLWIKQVTTSYGRINGGPITKIHPCQSFKIEIKPEADAGQSNDINFGVLEVGMANRANKYADIEMMDMIFDDNTTSDRVYFPFKAQNEEGTDNAYQTSVMSKDGRLFIVIDPKLTAKEVYPEIEK